MSSLKNRFMRMFFKAPNSGASKANKNLETNVRTYVNGYVRNRNDPTKVPPLNKAMANALHKYINSKRLRAAANVAAAVGNANGTKNVQNKAAATMVNASTNTNPENLGANVAQQVIQAGGNAKQAAAGAAAAAKQQALNQGKSLPLALTMGGNAAAEAAVQHTNTPGAAVEAANNGANAANLNANKAAKIAKIKALLNAVNVNKFNNIPIANLEKLKANLLAINVNNSSKTAVLGMINSKLAANVAQNVGKNTLSNAQISLNRINGMLRRNVPPKLSQGTANALRRKLNANVALARNAGLINAERNRLITNYRSRINASLVPTRANLLRKQANQEN